MDWQQHEHKKHTSQKKTLNHRLIVRIRSDWYDSIQPSVSLQSLACAEVHQEKEKYMFTSAYIYIGIYLSQMQRHFKVQGEKRYHCFSSRLFDFERKCRSTKKLKRKNTVQLFFFHLLFYFLFHFFSSICSHFSVKRSSRTHIHTRGSLELIVKKDIKLHRYIANHQHDCFPLHHPHIHKSNHSGKNAHRNLENTAIRYLTNTHGKSKEREIKTCTRPCLHLSIHDDSYWGTGTLFALKTVDQAIFHVGCHRFQRREFQA